jgi:3'-phosphoadenosine 5'-phosphosulfate sulfotransferase (PAPS reductase)/FAD synthetase
MALMAAKGEITPMPDYAIFADTQAEPDHIYEWLDWLESQLPFPVLRVTRGSLLDDIMNPEDRSASPPFFTASPSGYGEGILMRQCTRDNKTWREMKANDPKSWEQAVAVDKHIRDDFRGTTSKIFIHRSLKPLDEADLSDPAKDQIVMDFGDECDGMCGV